MKIPLSSVSLTDREKGYVAGALETGWISGTGEYVRRFEQALAQRLGRKYVISVANGTLALELALRALGIQAGDEIIVPALTFVAPAAVVLALGATPVLADITAESWTIDPVVVRPLITPRTKAIIAVDVLGHPCAYDALLDLGVPVIEDAAEAHGAHYYRMTNLSAAIGLGQVERWDELIAARARVAQCYDHWLAGAPLQRRPVAPWAAEACWLYTRAALDRDVLIAGLRLAGIDARPIWVALPDLPPYSHGQRGDYGVARRVSSSAFLLPTWAHMPEETIQYVAQVVLARLQRQSQDAPPHAHLPRQP